MYIHIYVYLNIYTKSAAHPAPCDTKSTAHPALCTQHPTPFHTYGRATAYWAQGYLAHKKSIPLGPCSRAMHRAPR